MTALIDRPSANPDAASAAQHEPAFFSENIGGLSTTLSGVSSENIVIRDAGDKQLQTVLYRWGQ